MTIFSSIIFIAMQNIHCNAFRFELEYKTIENYKNKWDHI